MAPVSPVLHTEVIVSIGHKTSFRVGIFKLGKILVVIEL